MDEMNIVKIKHMDTAAEINLSCGANCISLRNERLHVRVLREPDYSKNSADSFLYGMPVLFPVNRISGGAFEFEGRVYRFPINEPQTNCHLHGYLHTAEFKAEEIGESFVRCCYESDGLYDYFPHKFKVEITYSIFENGLVQESRIFNLSKTDMPVFLGFHTTFNIPFAEGSAAENIRIYAEVGAEIERDINYLPTGEILNDDVSLKLNRGEFFPFEKKISKHYKAKKNGAIILCDISRKLKIVYENDVKFGWRLFYNGNADEYICLEPQTCMVNCQNSQLDRAYTGFDYIKSGSDKTYISKISIEKYEN